MSSIREQAARLSRKKRTRTVPQAESLDDRVVPAVVGAGHGGFVVQAAAQRQNPYVLRLQEMRQQMQAHREARIEQIQAFREQRLAQINAHRIVYGSRFERPAPNSNYLQALRARRMVSFGASTPRGPLAYSSSSLGPNTTSPYHPTSPNDFPFGPGGFYSVQKTPDGSLVGLMGAPGSTPSFSGSSGASTPTSMSSMAPNSSTSLTTTNPSASTATGTSTGSNSTTTPNPTSPNDFPFGPGGFYTVTTTPNGELVGLM